MNKQTSRCSFNGSGSIMENAWGSSDAPLPDITICPFVHPKIENSRGWLGHIRAVLDADLNCPIILDDEGDIMDGRHRVAKAILEGKATIKYVRFDKTPPWDYVVSED